MSCVPLRRRTRNRISLSMSDELEGSRFPSWKTALVVAVPTAAVCIGVYIWYRRRKHAKLQQSPLSGTEAEKPAKSAQPSVAGLTSSTISLGTTDKPNDEDSPAEVASIAVSDVIFFTWHHRRLPWQRHAVRKTRETNSSRRESFAKRSSIIRKH